MSVFTATLIAIAGMACVALMTLPLIGGLSGWAAWQAVPREVYAGEQQQVFRLRPSVLWVVFGVVSFLARSFEWLHWPYVRTIVEGLSTALLGVLLLAHFIWAFRLLRRGVSVDGRLRHFARYVAWGSAAGILLLITGTLFRYAAA